MLGIVFTTPAEASSFATVHVDGRVDPIEAGTPVQMEAGWIVVAGPGKMNAALVTERLLRAHDLDRVLHVGTGVGLDEALSTGDVMGASFVLEGDRVELDDPTYPRMPLSCPLEVDAEGTLVTQDHVSDDAKSERYWERLADVRDETGYAVAFVAAQHGVPCHIAKAVASHAGDESDPDPSLLREARSNVAAALQSFVT